MNIINWWNNLEPLTKQEERIIKTCLEHNLDDLTQSEYEHIKEYGVSNIPEITSNDKFNELTNEYFSLMPYCNCSSENKDLSFEVSATTFINKLFEIYVDDDTLVISSDSEHPNVKKQINKCKNTLILSHYTDIRGYNIEKIINESKKYKKVFVYIIGTRNDTGEITPQLFFEELKKTFINNNINHIIVLDDVQGMFLVPRDYRLFDYVIGTAHALSIGYDMGIMISNSYLTGIKAYNWGKEYLKSLSVILKRKNKMNIFRDVLIQYYSKYLTDNNSLSQELVVPYIFYMKIPLLNISQEIIDNSHFINLLISAPKISPINFIQMRSHWFIKDTSLLPKCVNIIDNMLSSNYNEDYVKSIILGEKNG